MLQGLAKNGGLFIPETIPALPADWHTAWEPLTFNELALEIFSLFIGVEEVPRADLEKLIAKSYASFRHPDTAPLLQMDAKSFLLLLYYGPTLAFKDVALQFLGNLFEYFLERKNAGKPEGQKERVTVVGATSGDTGG